MQPEYESDIDDNYYYNKFPSEETEVPLTDYYKDLLNTKYEPFCEYSSCSFYLSAFSPYDMDITLFSELNSLLPEYQETEKDLIAEWEQS